jgi:hypothetical protein
MKGEEHAALDRPPNHHLFDPKNTKVSPVLRRRLENTKAQQVANVAPVINFSFTRDFAEAFRGGGPTIPPNRDPPPPVYTAPALMQNAYDLNCPTLLQANQKPGIDMPLDTFCQCYDLDDGIKNRFKEHRYKHARMFCFLTVKDMEGMAFMAGEIAEVRDAIDRWSIVA